MRVAAGVSRAKISRRARHGKRRGAQLRVLLAILRRLTADDWSVDKLAEDLGVHRRTVWRVLAAIRAQCPLESQRESGNRVSYYRLPRRWWT